MLGILGGDARCPIARSLDVLGEKWTLLIVRDALLGATRFSQFQQSLGVPREVLTARLASLTEGGVLERRSYRDAGARTREEYVLTEAGRELSVVLLALAGWADQHHPAAEGSDLRFEDDDGGVATLAVVSERTGAPIPANRLVLHSPTLAARHL